jgi:hypothetical protein
MKCLTLFLHASVRDTFTDCLRATPEVSGFTLSECNGHSGATELEPFAATRDLVVGYIPRIRVDVVLEEQHVDAVLGRLGDCCSKPGAAGFWMVTDVIRSGRL